MNASPGRRSRMQTEIHVMSYNVLADCLAKPENGHEFQGPHILDFSFRGPRIIEEIRESHAGLLCL